VAERRLVLDANILIRAVLGTRVRELIERHSATVAMIAPDAAFTDLDRYVPEIFAKRRLSPAAALPVIEQLRAAVYELSVAAYADRESDARARIGIRDMDDWPVVASALVA
jgi:predicted nucleic acid-binding protein